jgi:uncharacterized protein (TIGR02145 family)
MKICYLDFDKTIQELAYPETDSFYVNAHCIEFVKLIKELGYKVVLNSYRADLNNGSLEQALEAVESYIQFDEIAPIKITPQSFDLNNDTLFIDDESEGIPLIQSTKILGALVVDFSRIIALFDLKNSEIQIGSQIWINKNWNPTTFCNSDSIPIAKTKGEWHNAVKKCQPACCRSLDFPYEILYNWYALNDPRGIVPKGYRIPNTGDVNLLLENLGGATYGGVKLKSTEESIWEECAYLETDERERKNNLGNCTGFNAVPVGLRKPDGWYQGRAFSSNFWVINNDASKKQNVLRLLEGVEAAILESAEQFESHSDFSITQYGFSIRLIKNI